MKSKEEITKIIYQNSHDCGEGLVINFENIPKVIDLIYSQFTHPAGAEVETGKNKPFIVANVREILDGDFSFSRQVELFNEVAERFYASCITDGKGYSREQIKQAGDDGGIEDKDIDMLISQLPDLPTPSTDEWVDVRERLPKEDGNNSIPCLCWDDYHKQKRVLCYNEYHNVWDQEDGDDVYTEAIGGKVTHWQPLPAPPKH